MSEKSLAVRVAEALGVDPAHEWQIMNRNETGVYISFDSQHEAKAYLAEHFERLPNSHLKRDGAHVVLREVYPPYDTNWCVTGPLIVKYGISLLDDGPRDAPWRAAVGFCTEPYEPGYDVAAQADGATPLIAVCNLIVAMPGLLTKETNR